jgi:ABC-2 type transport system ATP-binding protein
MTKVRSMSVSVKNITKLYETQKALDNVSFEVNSGEIVGFLGPNGAGKSTMMKIITCYIPQTSGSASVCGSDVTENTIEVRKNVGYLPEHNPLYLDMYVKEYLEFVAGIHGLKNATGRINEMIGLTGLELEKRKKIGALSKGYRQRVGLAQALIHNPRVLILDEPTSGLDPNQLVEIRTLIREIGREKTVILSTHIMQEVKAICDRVIIINKGKLVADEKADALQSSKGEEIIIVEFDRSVEEEKLNSIDGIDRAQEISSNKWKLTARTDIRPALFSFAVKEGLTVLTLQKQEENLEDIFQKLTKNN